MLGCEVTLSHECAWELNFILNQESWLRIEIKRYEEQMLKCLHVCSAAISCATAFLPKADKDEEDKE